MWGRAEGGGGGAEQKAGEGGGRREGGQGGEGATNCNMGVLDNERQAITEGGR